MSTVTDSNNSPLSLPRKSHQNGKTTAPAPPLAIQPFCITTIDGKSIPETEPCLLNGSEDSGKKPRVASSKGQLGKVTIIVRNMEDTVRDKSGLSRKGVYYLLGLLVLLFVLCLVVVTLAACWPRVSHEHEFPVCGEGACLRASAQIREALDNSISPCTDIWSFSCGGWLKQHNLPLDRGSWDQKRELLKLEAAKIGEMVTTLPLPLRISSVDWKLKYFYEACLDVDSTNAEKEGPLKQIITGLVATLVALVHGRPEPEAGYAYPRPIGGGISLGGGPSLIGSGGGHGINIGHGGGGGGGLGGGYLASSGGGSGGFIGSGGSHGGSFGIGHGGLGGLASGSGYDSGISLGGGGGNYVGSGGNYIGVGSNYVGGGSNYVGGGSNYVGGGSNYVGGGSNFVGGGSNFVGGGGLLGGGGLTTVQKHIYVHVPPPEPEEFRPQRPIHVGSAQKHYKIIFIKAPTQSTPTAPTIPLQAQNEEKTLVYVLVKKPDEAPEISIPTAIPTQPSKPEVYFIRYKTQKDHNVVSGLGPIIGGGSTIIGGGSGGSVIGGGGIVETIEHGHGGPSGGIDLGLIGGGTSIGGGHGSGTIISGGGSTLSTQYGPPGQSGPYK